MKPEHVRSRRPWDDWPTLNSHSPLGYVYAVAYSTGAVKIGMTRHPRRRANQLRNFAAQVGATITDAWLSRPHGEYVWNETKLHAAAAALGPRWAAETFACSIHDVIAAAEGLKMTGTPPPDPVSRTANAERIRQRRERARAMALNGETHRFIAEQLGCSVGTVHADLSYEHGPLEEAE